MDEETQKQLVDQAKEFLRDAVAFSTDSRVSVTVTYAQSKDRMIAKRNEQLILSGIESTTMTHCLRAMHDGILVGINTVLCDDPRLNVRLPPATDDAYEDPQPIVLDSRLQIPTSARLVTNTSGKRPWVFTAENHPEDKRRVLEGLGVRVIVVPNSNAGPAGRLCLDAVVSELYALGIRRLMVEGGASVIGAFMHSGIPENIVITSTPVVVGHDGVSVDPIPPGLSIVSDKRKLFGRDVVEASRIKFDN
ncbi:2,5-diamino-6-(ribosylamino)-4(3H)-pyrimidinone 5'-phosphate reductase [Coemansia sp. RSA 1933]|nr:2,5-diamino-6-(ribosylamino)-4(3H)-pyrimidinone 5'-phosphate reductase [Coemansia sp. RSA 1933]